MINHGDDPKPGETIEVEHNGNWQEAVVTSVKNGMVAGYVVNQRNPTSFAYTLGSYRTSWRWSQRRPT